MKKNSLIIYALLAGSVLLGSCGKKFLETNPTDAVPEEDVFKTADNVETVITGTWSYMMETYYTFANPGYGAILRTSDAMGTDVNVNPQRYGYYNAYNYSEMVDNTRTRVTGFWTLLYKVIDNCNGVIAKVDQATGSETKKKYLKGQAYALRAHCYLTLASFYQFGIGTDPNAKAVPVYTEPSGPTTEGKSKSTVSAVYALIVNDLKEAETLLTAAGYTRDATRKYKIDLSVVKGLQARAYLYSRQWQEAAKAADIARNGYPLMSGDEYNKGFNDLNNVEWIWGQAQTPNQRNASDNFHFLDVSTPASYYYSFNADPFFKNYFQPTDVRYRLFEWDTLPSREGYLRYKKFRFRDPGALVGDIVLMRSAEMYLIAAEGNARNGNIAAATERLNELRTARNAFRFNPAGSTQQQVIDTILLERRKELWGEGFSLADINRTGGTVARKQFTNAAGGDSVVLVRRTDGSFKSVKVKGHTIVELPDGSDFKPLSRYYLFTVPESELRNNPNINN